MNALPKSISIEEIMKEAAQYGNGDIFDEIISICECGIFDSNNEKYDNDTILKIIRSVINNYFYYKNWE